MRLMRDRLSSFLSLEVVQHRITAASPSLDPSYAAHRSSRSTARACFVAAGADEGDERPTVGDWRALTARRAPGNGLDLPGRALDAKIRHA
jgi:hypothetical protein